MTLPSAAVAPPMRSLPYLENAGAGIGERLSSR